MMKIFSNLIEALELTDIEKDYFLALINDQLDLVNSSSVRDEWASKGVPYRTQEYLAKVMDKYSYSRDHSRRPKGQRFSLEFFIRDNKLATDDSRKKIASERANWERQQLAKI